MQDKHLSLLLENEIAYVLYHNQLSFARISELINYAMKESSR